MRYVSTACALRVCTLRVHVHHAWRTHAMSMCRYMDYHLSLYCFLDTVDSCSKRDEARADMVDMAWESASV